MDCMKGEERTIKYARNDASIVKVWLAFMGMMRYQSGKQRDMKEGAEGQMKIPREHETSSEIQTK